MLVTLSDLHLHDGTAGPPTDVGLFHLFAERLAEMARHASWRTDGAYRPVERIDLVLLGDVLDITGSAGWLSGTARPWHDPLDRATVQRVAETVAAILRNNREAARVLRALASDGAIRIPAAMSHPLSMRGDELVQVPVRIHYMVGNVDWPLHVTGAPYDLIRQQVAHALGLANVHTRPFPHDQLESGELLQTARQHRVLLRHGDLFDPLAFGEDRDMASLTDVYQIEVIARFRSELAASLGDELPEWIAAQLDRLAVVRPRFLAPIWLEGVLERGCPTPALRRIIKRQWDRTIEAFLDLEPIRNQNHLSPVDLVDGLSRALKFSHRRIGDWAARTESWLAELRGVAEGSYASHAASEPDYRNRRARHIVYGHTHQAETVPLDASFVETHVLNQIYFNLGTWQPTQLPTRRPGATAEFVPFEPLTLAAFYQADERSGRPFEIWSGSWGSRTPVEERSGESNARPAAAARPRAATSGPRSAPHFGAIPSGSDLTIG
ncbi:MAG TPA: hypothetical protein PLI18_05895 [Pirellulaceae bacterium]|nr:hypothetical protein [Pirellulaceae bacterium]